MDKLTYCNPLSVENVPAGRWLDSQLQGEDPRNYKDYRSISDPSVIYHEGKWILYPSYGVAYVSEDFVHWRHVDIGIPHLRYSPAIAQFRGKWYLHGHNLSELYVADDPLGPFTLCGLLTDVNGNVTKAADSCLFADGDRLYMYFFASHLPYEDDPDVERITGTVGVELDPERPWQFLHQPVWINTLDPSRVWQRVGEYNENERMGWVEGQWMYKRGSRYYLMTSGSGTQYGSYANGICYSDEGPLSGFKPQKNHDPFTEKRTGLVRGAGHGCLTEGPDGTLWTFYTSIFCYNFLFERRICMDPVGIDEDGELYCPKTTETPQYAPGVVKNPEWGNDAGLLPLTFMRRAYATSAKPGREPIYAADESVLTWWQPEEDDPEKCITFPLERLTAFSVEAVRIIWRDIGMETLDGIYPGPIQYVVEYAADPKRKKWEMLIDASENDKDLCIDYRQVAPAQAHGIRLRILGAPQGIQPGLVSLTAFGKTVHK